MPGHARDDLLPVHVLPVKQYFSDDPAVPVPFPVLNHDRFAGHQAGQMLPRGFAVELPPFGRIGALQPDFVLNVTSVEYHHRIAVDDPDDTSGEGFLIA